MYSWHFAYLYEKIPNICCEHHFVLKLKKSSLSPLNLFHMCTNIIHSHNHKSYSFSTSPCGRYSCSAHPNVSMPSVHTPDTMCGFWVRTSESPRWLAAQTLQGLISKVTGTKSLPHHKIRFHTINSYLKKTFVKIIILNNHNKGLNLFFNVDHNH